MMIIHEVIFWVLICIETLICIFSAVNDREEEMESPILFTIGILGFCATMYFMKSDVTLAILRDIKTNWSSYLLHAGVYFLMGLVWSIFRWFLKANKAGREFNEWWDEHQKYVRNRIKNRTKQTEAEIIKEAEDVFNERRAAKIPSAKNSKWLITLWIVLWPFSLVRYAVGKAFADFFTYVFNRMRGVYDAISNRAFGETKFKIDKEE